MKITLSCDAGVWREYFAIVKDWFFQAGYQVKFLWELFFVRTFSCDNFFFGSWKNAKFTQKNRHSKLPVICSIKFTPGTLQAEPFLMVSNKNKAKRTKRGSARRVYPRPLD